MRLLKTKSKALEFAEFAGDNIPLYAILSHTWGGDEISLQDVQHGVDAAGKAGKGYEKIIKTLAIAREHGFDYVWIDTCCIDKTSSAELSEAINSMYRWYKAAGVCYAYLADVTHSPSSSPEPPPEALEAELAKSRWFTRGWTLQELIAPDTVIFHNAAWQEIGTKRRLRSAVSRITRIPEGVLAGDNIHDQSIAQRMSWASERRTTRIEDTAYCLMGLFGINMPMLYGEGGMAFIRLQEEIMKSSDDHSIFTWGMISFARRTDQADRAATPRPHPALSNRVGGFLAPSPRLFLHCGNIVPSSGRFGFHPGEITLNNKGIHLNVILKDAGTWTLDSKRVNRAVLPCEFRGLSGSTVSIYVVSASGESNSELARLGTNVPYIRIENLGSEDHERTGPQRVCFRRQRPSDTTARPLWKATEEGNDSVATLLMDHGTEGTQDLLHEALRRGHEAMVRLMLERGLTLDDRAYINSMYVAAGNGHKEVVRLLLQHKGVLISADAVLEAAKGGPAAVFVLLRE